LIERLLSGKPLLKVEQELRFSCFNTFSLVMLFTAVKEDRTKVNLLKENTGIHMVKR